MTSRGRRGGRGRSGPGRNHYDPNKGTWDGQLPNASLTQPGEASENRDDKWPSIIERDGFVDLAAVTHGLSSAETSVLRRVFFRCGPGMKACYESQESMARYLRLSRRTVIRALDRLLELELVYRLTQFHGSGRSNGYGPRFLISPHFCHGVTNDGESQMDGGKCSICDTVSSHLCHCVTQTEGTEIRSDQEKHPEESGLVSEQSSVLSVHLGHSVTNGRQGVTNGVVIPECEVCGNPWTPDPLRHRTAVHRGLREFVCDTCRKAQVVAAKQRQGPL